MIIYSILLLFIHSIQILSTRHRFNSNDLGQLNILSSGAPRSIDCYSCMSMSYEVRFNILSKTYFSPMIFTNRCNDPRSEPNIPTVKCSTVCASMLEPDIEGGVFLGYKHIRGCLDKILRNGFNQSALRTHRFHQNNQCRTLSRSQLFNSLRPNDPPVLGDVQLCSCYGDRCNSSTSHSSTSSSTHLFILPFILILSLY